MAGFLLFSLILKHQVWGSRLLLPSFILWSPAIVVIIPQVNSLAVKAVVVIAWIISLLWVFGNVSRPIDLQEISQGVLDREVVYFANGKGVAVAAQQMVDEIIISECQNVGLKIGDDSWEYPIWMLLNNRHWEGLIQHVLVTNPSSILEDRSFDPCAIITDDPVLVKSTPEFSMTNFVPYYLLEKNP